MCLARSGLPSWLPDWLTSEPDDGGAPFSWTAPATWNSDQKLIGLFVAGSAALVMIFGLMALLLALAS